MMVLVLALDTLLINAEMVKELIFKFKEYSPTR
jgi:hypothetical protein